MKNDGEWTLMCPDECPGLADVYGDEFVELYTKYENEGKGRKTMKARDLWFQIMDAQMETGTPYLVYKDAANRKSNQKILEQSNQVIYAQKLSNIQMEMKLLYATWQVLLYLHLLRKTNMEVCFIIMTNYTK